jgi:hypothetical protein
MKRSEAQNMPFVIKKNDISFNARRFKTGRNKSTKGIARITAIEVMMIDSDKN